MLRSLSSTFACVLCYLIYAGGVPAVDGGGVEVFDPKGNLHIQECNIMLTILIVFSVVVDQILEQLDHKLNHYQVQFKELVSRVYKELVCIICAVGIKRWGISGSRELYRPHPRIVYIEIMFHLRLVPPSPLPGPSPAPTPTCMRARGASQILYAKCPPVELPRIRIYATPAWSNMFLLFLPGR